MERRIKGRRESWKRRTGVENEERGDNEEDEREGLE